ncbi:PadR family transcriptional regulator [Nocardiopsis sp. EMB25]|uniref:PadR family transcriptional regulator n=1 Tax=Nocardiopsis TaxID=2013 RepID=UPI0003460016|nr:MULTISPECIES: PadR family transcriptional regulator [Nocardiopsis]MCY9785793.1 PadR family transcriptional regulator [Nocardiopsis sp. EMB25]
MSVRQGFLALLSHGPKHGYQLRAEFEARSGGTWPLNIGQAYTTLGRLERDGLIASVHDDDPEAPERYALTDAGRTEVESWWNSPVKRGAPARDELALKLALAVTTPGVDVRAVVDAQRAETLRGLQDYTRLKRSGRGREATEEDPNADLAWDLVLDALVFSAQAEMQWLDHVESRLARASRTRGGASAPAATRAPEAARRPEASR